MDDIVKAALAKWPNVPNCYGWLGLDARGNWYMRDDQAQAAGPFAGGIDDEAAFSCHEFGEVEGESVCIVELESEGCGDRGGLWGGGEAKHLTFKEIDATIEGAVECFFFAEENFFDLFLALAKIGKNVAHFSGEGGDEFGEKGFGESERSAIADGTSEDASEDIIAVCVAGLDAIGDGEAEGTDVIGDHPHRDIDFLGGGERR